MKNNNKKEAEQKPGTGNKSSVRVEFTFQLQQDNKTITNVSGIYHVSVQIESIDYLVREAATALGQVFTRIGKPAQSAIA